ncbi:hypothetical protein Tco_0795322 [Tanacetum coccineum]
MNSITLTPLSSSSSSHITPKLKPLYKTTLFHTVNISQINKGMRMRRSGRCKGAELLHDAPFVVAMGACVLNSLVFPLPVGPHDNEDGESVIESADARFAVMGIISFIPYFNWMSWVFAWMDTEDKRYAVYALVYLAPYIRSKLSLSPEESWLPIASILVCILHIQLEASIKNGDLQEFQLFKKSPKKNPRNISEQETRKDEQNLPSANDQVRDKIRSWGIPKKPTQKADPLEEEEDKKRH